MTIKQNVKNRIIGKKALGLPSILIAALVLLLVFSASGLAALASHDGDQGTSYTEILVKFKPDTDASTIAEVHRQNAGTVVDTIPQLGVQVVQVPTSQATARLVSYASNPFVEYAETDSRGQLAAVPDDTDFSRQWGLTTVQAPQAWDITHGSSNIQIAILDTGIDQDHPDLQAKIVASQIFSGSATLDDVYNHGTHVAGIAAAITDNATGVAGLGYDSSLMIGKVFTDNGLVSASWLAQGITWAVDNGAEVINMSIVFTSPSSVIENAINYAWDHGVVLVASAGNTGSDESSSPIYPAAYDNVIAVAATQADDTLAGFSTYGNWVDVAAPGLSILSTVATPPHEYRSMSGTSMAAPHVAGLAALAFDTVSDSNGNGRLNDEVRYAIESTCDDIGVSGIGNGRINAYQALQASTTPANSTLDPADTVVTVTSAGAPVEGYRVYAYTADGTYAGSKVTDASGQAEFDIVQGSYKFRVYYNYSYWWSDAITTPGTATIDIPAATVVTVTAAGGPIGGCRVYAYTADGTYAGSKVTDASGQASFTLPQGSYKFRLYYEYTCWWSDAITTPGTTTIDIPAATVVTVTAAGGPIDGCRVYAYTADGAYAGSKVTDASGQASFTLPQGSYKFRVYYNYSYWWSDTITTPGTPTIDIPAATGG